MPSPFLLQEADKLCPLCGYSFCIEKLASVHFLMVLIPRFYSIEHPFKTITIYEGQEN